jgi:hypothetical protein
MRRRPLAGAVPAVLVVLALTACGATTHVTARAHVSACGSRAGSPPRVYRHVVWIVLENAAYDDVIGNRSAPYLNATAAGCGVATNYSAVAHPSLPNYIAMTSGSTSGIADDEPPSSHPVPGRSLFSQLGKGWRAFAESMPGPCARTDAGLYAARHNPPVYYDALRETCPRQDRPGRATIGARFTLVIPNLCHDGHNCPLGAVDRWLAGELGRLFASRAYRAGGTAVFVVWDESDTEAGNHVPAIVASPYTRGGTTSGKPFDHYSLLRTTESMLGLPCLAAACRASSMRSAFGL